MATQWLPGRLEWETDPGMPNLRRYVLRVNASDMSALSYIALDGTPMGATLEEAKASLVSLNVRRKGMSLRPIGLIRIATRAHRIDTGD